MGLDWQPTFRPKPGHEAEFEKIYRHFYEHAPIDVPRRKKWGLFRDERAEQSDRAAAKEAMGSRLDEIGVSPEEATGAPRIGFDAAADAWWKEQYESSKKLKPFEETLKGLRGVHVVILAPETDGLPVYSNGWIPGSYCAAYTFRAQMLTDAEEWLGHDLTRAAWNSYRAAELMAYGNRLLNGAINFASAQNIPRDVLTARRGPANLDTPAGQAHIVMSAARWCQWWGERGHGMSAWF